MNITPGKKDCDKWACDRLEKYLYSLKDKTILEEMTLDVVDTVDRQKVVVVALNNLGKKSGRFYKTDIVIDEKGNTYFPIKDNPNVYHINREVDKKGLKDVGRIFKILINKRKSEIEKEK